jgi:hypothetical protein
LAERPHSVSTLNPELVQEHLKELISSSFLRSSRRSQDFLEYVVSHTLAGDLDMLKERAIGEHVFNRPADYDTGQDSIVRVKANEVRKRLAQYYDVHPNSPLRVELASGSYVVQFHELRAVNAEPQEPDAAGILTGASVPVRKRRLWWIAAALVPLSAVLAYALLLVLPDRSLFATFWKPFITGKSGLLLCLPSPEAYRIYGLGKTALVQALRPKPPTEMISPPPPDVLRASTIVPEPNLLLGLGDARAMTLVYAFAAGKGKTPVMRVGAETTFAEMRSSPGVVIGGFTNPWTADLMQGGRFSFVSKDTVPGIYDTNTAKFICSKEQSWEPRHSTDCGIIARVMHSKTGHPALVAAGLDHFGTLAVGEFLTHPELLEPALRAAPAGWQSKNLQIVFEIEVVRDDVGPPKVLATHVW